MTSYSTDISLEFDASCDITMTDAAAEQVHELLSNEIYKDFKALRVFIQGGGCSGFQYGFTFEKDIAEDDLIVETPQATVVVDPMSYQYLMGAIIDYESTLYGSQFKINNPNATTTCGCGSSFST
jgi:iron-sulfur cluster insertion protein